MLTRRDLFKTTTAIVAGATPISALIADVPAHQATEAAEAAPLLWSRFCKSDQVGGDVLKIEKGPHSATLEFSVCQDSGECSYWFDVVDLEKVLGDTLGDTLEGNDLSKRVILTPHERDTIHLLVRSLCHPLKITRPTGKYHVDNNLYTFATEDSEIIVGCLIAPGIDPYTVTQCMRIMGGSLLVTKYTANHHVNGSTSLVRGAAGTPQPQTQDIILPPDGWVVVGGPWPTTKIDQLLKGLSA